MNPHHSIVKQVLRNCDISDARHAGVFSICGLALRLRDLYKWEKGLDPWIERESGEVLEWIGDKEQKWEEIIDEDYADLSISGRNFDPFDTIGINAALQPSGIFYGAGYAYSLKPTFFLSKIENRSGIDGTSVYTLSGELARDLLTVPALTQDGLIILRKKAALLSIWDKILYMNKSGKAALKYALDSCGIHNHLPKSIRGRLTDILDVLKGMYIYHELGEIKDTVFNEHIWRQIIAEFPHTPIELAARSVKDLLADTNEHGTLRHMAKSRHRAALAFYVAFFDGLRKTLFPELRPAFSEFAVTGHWPVIENAVSAGHSTAKRYAEKIMEIYLEGKRKEDMKWAKTEIEKSVLKELIP